jgi:hypothetical protein
MIWMLVGIHEVERGEQEMAREREQETENAGQESDESESGSGLENRTFGFNTPPDSPNALAQFMREQSLQYEGNHARKVVFLSTVDIQCDAKRPL